MKTELVILMDGRTVEVKKITLGQWKETRKSSSEFDNEIALVSACSEIPMKSIDDLDVPDYNELLRAAIKVNDPIEKPAQGTSVVTLNNPSLTLMGERITTVSIRMPKLLHARELDKITDPTARMEYMIGATTDLIELDDLAMGDYTLLMLAVVDFFSQGAVFFRQDKSKKLPRS